jgi:uncharacterized SAM-binding protein YcdF (DUF218 family)
VPHTGISGGHLKSAEQAHRENRITKTAIFIGDNVRVRTYRTRKKKEAFFRRMLGFWLLLPGLLILLFLSAFVWKAGNLLVYGDDFEHVEWALVLDGQSRDCERTEAAVDLFVQNKIDTLLLSSVRIFKTRYGSEFLIPDLIKQGLPRDNIFELRHDSYSTLDEAALAIGQFRLLDLDTVLLITSNYHSARTRFIYNSLAKGNPHFLLYPAPYEGYDADAWWASRNGFKTFILEFTKYFASRLEVAHRNFKAPVTSAAQTVQIIPDIGFEDRFPDEVELLSDSLPDDSESDDSGPEAKIAEAENTDLNTNTTAPGDTAVQGEATAQQPDSSVEAEGDSSAQVE